MNDKLTFRALTLCSALALGATPGLAHAYNNATHQSVVNLSWQVMRTAVKGDVSGDITFQSPSSRSLVPRFDLAGDCGLPASDARNHCGRQVSDAEWKSYVREIRASLEHLNELDVALPEVASSKNAGCNNNFVTWAGGRLGDYQRRISDGHMNDGDGRCEERKTSQAGAFAEFEVPEDQQKNQGLVLGWHAEHRDDDSGDSWIDMNPLVTGTIPGQILLAADSAWNNSIGVVLIPFVCVYEWLSGESCNPDDAKKLADRYNPVDVLVGIIPGIKNEDASEDAIGVWHHLNVMSGNSNWWDDRQGLFYEEGGPNHVPSGVDLAVSLAADLLFMTLVHSNSTGAERYEITGDETSFANPSVDRSSWKWQSDTIGHLQFSPLDNFALYGDMRFDEESDALFGHYPATGLGWPLHALGDATVPMHVVATTGWGHRPYEDFVSHNFDRLMFESCEDQSTGAAPCDPDQLKVAQLKQAREILERGFRMREFVKAHRDVRELVTLVASETYSLVQSDPAFQRVFCDACSAGYLVGDDFPKPQVVKAFTEIDDQQGYDEPEAYYDLARHPRVFELERALLVRSSAAILGYLMSVADRMQSVCTSIEASCGTGGGDCCGGATCGESGACCRVPSRFSPCVEDAECCTGSCEAGRCCDGVDLNATCTDDDDCCGGVCASNGKCLIRIGGACETDFDCVGDSSCLNGLCKHNTGGSCTSDAECASQRCRGGACRVPPRGFCYNSEECGPDALCDEEHCRVDSGGACEPGDCAAGLSCKAGICQLDDPR